MTLDQKVNRFLLMVGLSAPLQFLALVPGMPRPADATSIVRRVTTTSPTVWLERKDPKPGSFVLNLKSDTH